MMERTSIKPKHTSNNVPATITEEEEIVLPHAIAAKSTSLQIKDEPLDIIDVNGSVKSMFTDSQTDDDDSAGHSDLCEAQNSSECEVPERHSGTPHLTTDHNRAKRKRKATEIVQNAEEQRNGQMRKLESLYDLRHKDYKSGHRKHEASESVAEELNTKNNGKVLRTTKEQIACYLSFLQQNPQIKLHKNDKTRSKQIEELWSELTAQLNALKGPTRTPDKWRECLSHWRNQIRSRVRKAKAHSLMTADGSSSYIELTQTEQRVLDAFGSTAFDDAADVPIIGAEDVDIVLGDSNSASAVISDISSDTPSTSRAHGRTSDEMFSKILGLFAKRNEEENQFRDESLKCISKFAESMNNVAAAILTLSQAIEKNFNNK